MTQVYADAAVTIDCLGPLGPIENNAYLIRPVGGGPVIVVDAPAGAEAVVEALGDTPVSAIVVTHSHRDHWDGFEVLRAHTAAPVYAGAGETNLNPARGALPLADGTELPVGTTTVRVIATPGHTPGSICLLVGGAHLAGGALLTGDTLFPGGPGHSRTPEALQQLISWYCRVFYIRLLQRSYHFLHFVFFLILRRGRPLLLWQSRLGIDF